MFISQCFLIRDEPLFFWKRGGGGGGGGMRNLHAQTIFSATSTQTFFFSGKGFANNFFLRNVMLYYEEF